MIRGLCTILCGVNSTFDDLGGKIKRYLDGWSAFPLIAAVRRKGQMYTSYITLKPRLTFSFTCRLLCVAAQS